MATWDYRDAYDRVSFSLSCTDDAGILSGWQARRDGIQKEQEIYPTWLIQTTDEPNYLTVTSSSKGYDPSTTLYYKRYDSCYAEVNYKDIKKDTKSLEKALKFLKKSVSFRTPYQIPVAVNNPYFSIANIAKDTRIIRSIDSYGAISVLMGVEVLPGQWINATLEQKEYPTIQELGTALDMDFDSISTCDNYISAIADFGIRSSDISSLNLSSGQRGVFVAHYNSEKKSTNVTFQYLYRTPGGQYAYWSWSASIAGEQPVDLTRLKSIFTSLTYPGQLFLK
jgi:hypothetical protein